MKHLSQDELNEIKESCKLEDISLRSSEYKERVEMATRRLNNYCLEEDEDDGYSFEECDCHTPNHYMVLA